MPRLAEAKASASASPGTKTVAAAISFTGVAPDAFASSAGIALVASSLASTIASSQSVANVSVQVTRVVDIASGVVVYSLAGARRRLEQRRLQTGASGVTVSFVVQLPATAPAAAVSSVTSLLTPAPGSGGAAPPAFAAFATQTVVNIAAAATAAGNSALAAGVAGASVAVAQVAPSVVATPSDAASGTSGSGTGLGVGLGVAAALVAAGAAYYFRASLCGCSGSSGSGDAHPHKAAVGPIVIGAPAPAAPAVPLADGGFAALNPIASSAAQGLKLRVAPAATEAAPSAAAGDAKAAE